VTSGKDAWRESQTPLLVKKIPTPDQTMAAVSKRVCGIGARSQTV